VDQIMIIGARFLVSIGIRHHPRITQQTQSSRACTNGEMESKHLAGKKCNTKKISSHYQCNTKKISFHYQGAHRLRVKFLLRTDSGYPKDTGVTLFTLASPRNPLRCRGVGGRIKRTKKNPALAGWPRRFALVRATSRARVDVISVQQC